MWRNILMIIKGGNLFWNISDNGIFYAEATAESKRIAVFERIRPFHQRVRVKLPLEYQEKRHTLDSIFWILSRIEKLKSKNFMRSGNIISRRLYWAQLQLSSFIRLGGIEGQSAIRRISKLLRKNITSKRIELESPNCSGLENNFMKGFKTWSDARISSDNYK